MPNFSSLAGLEVAEKFVEGVGGGVVCTVIFVSNPTVVLCWGWGWGFDNKFVFQIVTMDSFYSILVNLKKHGPI